MAYVPPVQYTAPVSEGRHESSQKPRPSDRPPPPPPASSSGRSTASQNGSMGDNRPSDGVSRAECPPSSHSKNSGSGSQSQPTQQSRATNQPRIVDPSSQAVAPPRNSQARGQESSNSSQKECGRGGGAGRSGGRGRERGKN